MIELVDLIVTIKLPKIFDKMCIIEYLTTLFVNNTLSGPYKRSYIQKTELFRKKILKILVKKDKLLQYITFFLDIESYLNIHKRFICIQNFFRPWDI